MTTLDAALTLREAKAAHLEASGLAPDGGIEERWVKPKIGPIPVAYPNTKGRQRLVVAHDLHHLLADYPTTIVGEAETGAWELGSGMDDRTGVRLAIRVFGFALPWIPRRLFRAFVRGRGCQNLCDRDCGDELLDRTVAELRRELHLDRPTPDPTPEDRRAFTTWAAKAIAIVWAPVIPISAIAWYFLR
jgi:hypothetical protein